MESSEIIGKILVGIDECSLMHMGSWRERLFDLMYFHVPKHIKPMRHHPLETGLNPDE